MARTISGDLSKKESFFLKGVKRGERVSYNREAVIESVVAHYKAKFSETREEVRSNEACISRLWQKYCNGADLQEILNKPFLMEIISHFPVQTTYGNDLILPSMLRDEEVSSKV